MSKGSPKVHVNSKALKKGLVKKIRSEHANFTFRFERVLFEDFRERAKKEGYSATQVLEALMKSYLGR